MDRAQLTRLWRHGVLSPPWVFDPRWYKCQCKRGYRADFHPELICLRCRAVQKEYIDLDECERISEDTLRAQLRLDLDPS